MILATCCSDVMGADKCSHAPARFENACAFQLGVDLRYRICIDAKVNCQLPDCRQLFPWSQPSCRNRKLNCPRQLCIERHGMRRAECWEDFAHLILELRT